MAGGFKDIELLLGLLVAGIVGWTVLSKNVFAGPSLSIIPSSASINSIVSYGFTGTGFQPGETFTLCASWTPAPLHPLSPPCTNPILNANSQPVTADSNGSFSTGPLVANPPTLTWAQFLTLMSFVTGTSYGVGTVLTWTIYGNSSGRTASASFTITA